MAKETENKFQVPTDPTKLITWLDRRYGEARRLPERTSKLNIAYILGFQWINWDATKHRLMRAKPAARGNDSTPTVQITVNKIGALVERIIARLTRNSPIPECRPVTGTASDVDAAKVGTRVLTHEMHRLEWPSFMTRLYFWVVGLGWSFVHVRWDPEAGDIVGEVEGSDVHKGDIVFEEVPGTEIRLDPNARTWEAARWCVRTVTMTPEAIYEQYGVTGLMADTSERSMADEVYDLAAHTGANQISEAARSTSAPERSAVHQFWLRPGGRSDPAGLVVTWSGSTILEAPKPFPYDHGQLPFVPFSLLPGIGIPEGRTWVDDLRSQQNDYNDARSREATLRRILTPKILAARGQMDTQRLSSKVEVWDYAPTGPEPTIWLPDGRWLQQYEQAMSRADMEMGDRAGQAEVSQGKAPAGAPAAAILALQEADESKLAISARELASSTQRLGWHVLMLVKQYWSEERVIRTWSQDGVLEVKHFSGANLGEQLDVHLTAESALPRSKSSRAQLAMDLWDRKIITDPHLFVRMLEIPGLGFVSDDLNLDAAQAEREHADLVDPEAFIPEARVWHNHVVHIQTHDNFRKSEEYENLAPVQRARFDGHVDAHYAAVRGQMGQPTPVGTPYMPELAPLAPGPGGGGDAYMDPLTGMPPDPVAVASGQAASGLSHNPPSNLGGAGQVPGIDPETQARLTGQ